ncbi:MAG: rRNA pseudouridine synthase [Deltaproteobacteria bacterium]|nr:rRNA pseudouridine synthase [Deltaproteobacteria bacterium]
MNLIRLQKILARAGVASRREAEKIILSGKVKVNGKTVTELGTKADPEKDLIQVEGRKLSFAEKKVYYLLNKPTGYVTTMKDPRGRKTVADLLSSIEVRVYPVGRLDYDTSGLLIITNDGETANNLTHPKKEVDKRYEAKVKGIPSQEALSKLEKGIMLEDGMTAPARTRLLKKEGTRAWVEIIIHEGRNRQVRRMFEAIGHRVIKLKRVSLGPLKLGSLAPGKIRPLTAKERESLKALI